MKSFFTNLGKVLLCGAAIAMIGCTDLHSDIQEAVTEKTENYDQEIADLQEAVTEKTENYDQEIADLQSALDALEAELKKDCALKSKLEAVEAELAAEKAAVQAAIADLNAAIEAGDNAAIEAAQAAVEAAKADLNAAIDEVKAELAGMGTEVEGLKSRLDALEAACQCEEIAAQLAALDAYVTSLEESVFQSVQTVQEAVSALSNLLADETAARELADEELWLAIYDLQEAVTAVNNLIQDLEGQGGISAEDLEGIYGAINTNSEAISSVYVQLTELIAQHDQDFADLYAKVTVVEEAVSSLFFSVSDVQAELDAQIAALEAINGYIEELYMADTALQENITQLMNLTQLQLEDLMAADEELWSAYYDLQTYYTQLYNAYVDADEELKNELTALIVETKDELSQAITFVNNLIADLTAQVEDLAARVQSLVFIPEYSDGKATIEWGLLIDNDSAVNFLYNTVISYNTLDTFKTYAKKFINKVRGSRYYAYVVRQMKNVLNEMEDAVFGPLDDINAQLDAIFKEIEDLENNLQIDTPDADEIAEAFNELFGGIEELVSYYVAEQLSNAGIPADSDVDPQEITDNIIAELKAAFTFGDVDVNIDLPGFQLPDYKTIVKNLIKKYVKYFKAEGISKVKDIVNALESGEISASDIIDGLRLVEFKELLSDLLPVAKKLEAMILENTAILKKESVIRYKVQAQNSTAAAAAIAANWKEVLSYDVETVDVRAAAPGLKITKVVAKGDEIHVTVLPQNFNYRFYLTYILEDSFLYGAAESFFDKFGKTGLISYSAALVLNDGNNIRSTEYVNFVSGENPEIYTPEVVNDANQVVETNYVVLPKNIDSYEFCSDLHMAYLSVPYREAYTKSQLEKKGYSGIVEKKAVNYNQTTGIAGPCRFNGLVGTFYDYFSYPFETVWSVNDITLVVRYDVSFE